MLIALSKTLHRKSRKGFTLIELAIVLAVASLLFAGLWRLMSSGNTQLRDQAAADQHKQLIAAVQAFLATTEGTAWMTANDSSAGMTLPLPTSNTSVANCQANLTLAVALPSADGADRLCEFLPLGFTDGTTNAYGQTYAIQVKKDPTAVGSAPTSYSFMIKTTGGDTIPDTSGGRISSMIGNDGGFVYGTNVCGAANQTACGAFGSWAAAPVGDYAFGAVAGGQIASRTYMGISTSQNAPWLARVPVNGPTVAVAGGGTARDFNTIQSDIFLGNVSGGATPVTIFGANNGVGYGGSILNVRNATFGRQANLNTATENTPFIVNGCANPQTEPGPGESGYVALTSGCDYVAQVNGHMNITGFLKAYKLYATQFIYNAPSDERLKKDISPLDRVLDKFAQIRGYVFKMKGEETAKYGVMAQEIEKVFPEVVHEMDGGYKAVDYMGLIGPLVEAVHELKLENDKLKEEVQKLSSQKKSK